MTHRIIDVPFHIGDFLSGTMHMNATEIGAYWMLCIAHYQAGEAGLPDCDQQLARIARVTPKTWRKIRPAVERKFSVEGKIWRHKRVIQELKRISLLVASQREKSLKRWKPDDAAALPQHSRGNPNHYPLTNQVLKPEEGNPSPRERCYDVARSLSMHALLKARKRARELNRDWNELCRLYNGFVGKHGEPGCVDLAFPEWIEKFTKGVRL